MKKTLIAVLSLVMALGIIGCESKQEDTSEIINGIDESTSVFTNTDASEDEVTENEASEAEISENETGKNETSEEEIGEDETESPVSDMITEEQALSAIKNYCYANNPDLEGIEKAGEYPVYWEIISSDENEIVVLFRSYTAAQIRYYIDPNLGDVYVTEFVPGITIEEEMTDESFNARDYLY